MLDKNFSKVSNEFIDSFQKLSGSAIKVYLLFKRMINEDKNNDEIWPSYKYIKYRTGLCKTSISKSINELIEYGWINEIEKGFNSVNHYHVNDISSPENGLLERRLEMQEINSNRSKNRIIGQKIDIGSSENRQQVVQKMDTNNTNTTILKNDTNIYIKEEDIKNKEEKNVLDISMAFAENNEELCKKLFKKYKQDRTIIDNAGNKKLMTRYLKSKTEEILKLLNSIELLSIYESAKIRGIDIEGYQDSENMLLLETILEFCQAHQY